MTSLMTTHPEQPVRRRSSTPSRHLARRHEQADRTPIRIGHGMKLGVHAAFRATDQSPEAPFFTRRLEAVRCAFR